MKNIQKFHNLIVAAFTSCAIALVAAPVWAQNRGGEILQDSVEAANVSTESMDKMWNVLLASDAALYNQIVELAKILLLIGFFFLMMAFARAIQSHNTEKIIEIVAWTLAVHILIFNNAAMLKQITLGARNFINDKTKSVLLIQVGDLTVQDALQDVILTDKIRDQIRAVFADCEAKEGDEQLQCLEEGALEAKEIVKVYETAFRFPGLIRFAGNVNKIYDEVMKRRANGEIGNVRGETILTLDEEVSSLIWQSTTNSASRDFLKSFQNWFSYGYEFAMMLTGILGPLAVAASLIPKQPRAVISWAIAFFSIGTLKLSYNVLIGFAALYASQASMRDIGSSGFLLMMSIGAPLISIAVAGGGGAAIFFALGRTTAVLATVIPVAGSAASSAASRQ